MSEPASLYLDPGAKIAGEIPDELPEPEIDLGSAILDGEKFDQNLTNAVVDGTITRTMDGASSLTLNIEDAHRHLVHSGIFAEKFPGEDIYLSLDERDWALVKISKNGDIFELTFENRAIYELRKYNKPLKAYRDTTTRAEFILSMLKEVRGYHIYYYIPELHTKQTIAKKTQKPTKSAKSKLKHRGFGANKITVKHKTATRSQKNNIERVLDVGSSLNAPYPVMVAAVETVTQESNASAGATTGSHIGLFQQDESSGSVWRHLGGATREPERDAHAFFHVAMQVYQQNPQMTAAQISLKTQGPGGSDNQYGQWKSEAIQTIKTYGAHGGSGSITLNKTKRYPFQRGDQGKKEDSWTCIKRLADEVLWRAFVVDNTFYYIEDEELMRQAARMEINEDSPGVDTIDYDLDMGKKVNEVTVHARIDRWDAPPGAKITLDEKNGPAQGDWLVWETTRPIFDALAEITLHQPQKPKPEPAAGESTVTLKGGGTTGISSVDKAYAKAKAIHKKHYSYKWGGGHANFSGPYDCSGGVSAVLHAAGWLKSPEATGALASWGHGGTGKYLTVWVKNGGPGGGHTFIEFHMPGKKVEHWGTGRWGKSFDGPGFNPQLHPHAGFTPRHWPGT